jgi:hypothetical protein
MSDSERLIQVKEGYQPNPANGERLERGYQPVNSGGCAPVQLNVPSFQSGIQKPTNPSTSGNPASNTGE